MTPARIAFVAPLAWHAISGEAGYVGGAEMQQARLLRTLAARGHDVWMVSADFGQPRRVTVDGVIVERAYAPFAGIRGLRFFHPRWSGVLRALERVRPDVVYQRTAGAFGSQPCHSMSGCAAASARSTRPVEHPKSRMRIPGRSGAPAVARPSATRSA